MQKIDKKFVNFFFGRLTFSRKNVNLPKQFELVKMEMLKTLALLRLKKSYKVLHVKSVKWDYFIGFSY